MARTKSLLDGDLILVDDGVREEAAAHLLDLLAGRLGVLRREVDPEELRAVDRPDSLEPEKLEGLVYVVPFGVRDALAEADLHSHADHPGFPGLGMGSPFLGLSRSDCEMGPEQRGPVRRRREGPTRTDVHRQQSLRREGADRRDGRATGHPAGLGAANET